MKEKSYGWKGWKMPIFHLDDPDYCEFGCPICRNARKGNRLAKAIQKTGVILTFEGLSLGKSQKEEIRCRS